MSFVRGVHDQDFADVVLGASVPVLVDFHADWCGPVPPDPSGPRGTGCRAHVDVLHPPRRRDQPGDGRGLPGDRSAHVLVFVAGEPVLSIVGARPKRVLRDLLLGLSEAQRA